MKKNGLLFLIFIGLLGMAYLVKWSEYKADRETEKSQHLISFRSLTRWSLVVDKGELRLNQGHYFWNFKKLTSGDKKLMKVVTIFSDWKIIRSESKTKEQKLQWLQQKEKARFKFNGQVFSIGELNPLTGRFFVLNVNQSLLSLIEDQSVLNRVYSSFEQGQFLKYKRLIGSIQSLNWDL